jgi:hypothetical protein
VSHKRSHLARRLRSLAGRGGVAVALAALLLLGPWPPTARAHGGNSVLHTLAGPYGITATLTRAGGLVDETVTVSERASGRPPTAATVTLVLTDRDGHTLGPYVAQAIAGVAEVRFPPAPSGASWTVSLTIQGPAGEVTIQHPYALPGPWWQSGEIISLALLSLLLGGILAYRRWVQPHRARSEQPADALVRSGDER